MDGRNRFDISKLSPINMASSFVPVILGISKTSLKANHVLLFDGLGSHSTESGGGWPRGREGQEKGNPLRNCFGSNSYKRERSQNEMSETPCQTWQLQASLYASGSDQQPGHSITTVSLAADFTACFPLEITTRLQYCFGKIVSSG